MSRPTPIALGLALAGFLLGYQAGVSAQTGFVLLSEAEVSEHQTRLAALEIAAAREAYRDGEWAKLYARAHAAGYAMPKTPYWKSGLAQQTAEIEERKEELRASLAADAAGRASREAEVRRAIETREAEIHALQEEMEHTMQRQREEMESRRKDAMAEAEAHRAEFEQHAREQQERIDAAVQREAAPAPAQGAQPSVVFYPPPPGPPPGPVGVEARIAHDRAMIDAQRQQDQAMLDARRKEHEARQQQIRAEADARMRTPPPPPFLR